MRRCTRLRLRPRRRAASRSRRSPASAGSTLKLWAGTLPGLIRLTKSPCSPLLTPAQEAARPENAAVVLFGLFLFEELLRAPLLRERGFLLVHLYLFCWPGDGRF